MHAPFFQEEAVLAETAYLFARLRPAEAFKGTSFSKRVLSVKEKSTYHEHTEEAFVFTPFLLGNLHCRF